jgi:prepilin-type N-terminal cleavage/methylation domain-containing protein/prepilin-type processing-associated H-X9-DG protein
MRRVGKPGFTMIELLVAMAVIGVLVALLMPAVQSARASARRITCRNQARQLGLALHLYHDGYLCFPPGSYVMGPSFPIQSGWGWGAMILPSVEQNSLYRQIDFGRGTAVGGNLSLIAASIPLWRCPAEVAAETILAVPIDGHPPFDLASGNYCGSEGILSAMSCVRMANIRDGASQTLLLGERMVQAGDNGALPFTSAWCGQAAFADAYEYRSVPHLMPSRLHPVNASPADPLCFGGRHAGGANFILADGSARFLNENIDGKVWEALGTARGGEAVTVP